MKKIFQMFLSFLILLHLAFPVLAKKFVTNENGIDPRNFNKSVSACRDFYTHANGSWLRRNPIPAEYSSWNTFREIDERNNKVLKNILESLKEKSSTFKKGSIEQKVADFYKEGMDTQKIENVGLTPLEPHLFKIQNIQSSQDVEQAIIDFHAMGLDMVFVLGAEPDLIKSSKVIAYTEQYGLGLPDRDYYTKNDTDSRRIRVQYLNHLKTIFTLLGDSASVALEKAKTVLDLETKLAKASLTRLERRNPKNTYNLLTLEAAQEITPKFNWNNFFEAVDLKKVKTFSMAPKTFFVAMNELIEKTPAKTWQAYFQWHLIKKTSRFLPQKFETAHFNFYNKTLAGQKAMPERWKSVRYKIDDHLGEALGKLYVKEQFTPKAKKIAMAMIRDLQAALKTRLKSLDWMEDATKRKALKKLATFNPKIGYPKKWNSYKDFDVKNDSYLENFLRARKFELEEAVAKVGKSPNKDEWHMQAYQVNAYYNPQLNEIVFPAGILQPPYFDPNIDKPVNYGAMGAVIGHEIMHGYDDKGSQFDAKGDHKNWWTDQDRKEFDERTAILVKQYNRYSPLPGYRVNGKLTLGENIGDLGGLSLAYAALKDDLDKNDELIDGLTPTQRFFHSWAQAWRYKITRQSMKMRLRTDPHAPPKFRVNGVVANMPEFQEAFSCKVKDRMVLPENKRANIW